MQLYVDFDNLADIDFNALFIEIGGKTGPYFVESVKDQQKKTPLTCTWKDVDTIEKASVLVKKDIYLPNKTQNQKRKKVTSP